MGFTAPLEGAVHSMYADVKDLVTCGYGDLIDPMVAARSLPWVYRASGLPASQSDIAMEWHRVKDGKLSYGTFTPNLVLTDAAVTDLVLAKLDHNELYLSRRWSNWDQWPADGQLMAHSCAWAAGAAWHAPLFDLAAEKLDFGTIAGPPGNANTDPSCRGAAWLNDAGNPGLRPRNLKNKSLAWNAKVVLADGRDPEVLYWPITMDG
jgi:hypothetical protein